MSLCVKDPTAVAPFHSRNGRGVDGRVTGLFGPGSRKDFIFSRLLPVCANRCLVRFYWAKRC